MNENSDLKSTENPSGDTIPDPSELAPSSPDMDSNNNNSDETVTPPRSKGGAPRGNSNAFKHGLASLSEARKRGLLARGQKKFRVVFYESLVEQAGGAESITPARRYLAELISPDCGWLNRMVEARDMVLRQKPEYLSNIAALSKLDGSLRGVINSVSANLDRFGYDRVPPRAKTLEELFAEDSTNEPQPGAAIKAQGDDDK